MDSRPRFLLLGPPSGALADWLAAAEVVPVGDPAAAAELLRAGAFAAVVADPAAFARYAHELDRDEVVLAHLDEGVAVLDRAGIVTWANAATRALCPAEPVGCRLLDALAARTLAANDPDPLLAAAAANRPVSFRVFRPDQPDRPYLDVAVRPVPEVVGPPGQLVVFIRNVTPEVEQQRKLDALHQAGRELAGLDPDQLAEMNTPTRVELLKQNLRRFIRDLLHYDIIEVRLLDRRTGELKPLLEDGMTPEAARRVLFARPSGNGVTGYVAAIGRSHLISDTATDPLYIEGAHGARSSMTVPLVYQDAVIGTLNVESPRPDGFGADDLQFTELFSKEIAAALHTLDLLSAQQVTTAAQSIDAINRELALPVDDVLASAAVLLLKLGPTDPEAAAHLRRILARGEAVKDSVRKVARDMCNWPSPPDGGAAAPLLGRRVLVVDPDERMRRSAHQLLGRLGAGVETAGTAIEGLALLACATYDVVLLDIKPPDMGGYEAYRRLRDARPGTRVALTTGFGYDVAHSIVRARQDGLQYVLFKPFRQEQVVTAVLNTPPPGPLANGKPE
ncbi:response regulator [Fimbriiglobus ruber]|uniref:Putative sensor kinase n=1 Tax=Fimbriiglobus ruber TaxID=1908690 RepID=A0A225DK18_9BACT|nr:response regulator [Fimbriiglobus ruber]OWK41712.1 putative sensor kinase [Fimbriiglobus ruber]